MLTKEEKEILSMVACDNETGNHLLGRERSKDYWYLRNEWAAASTMTVRTERQAEICEYVRQCSDYDYYQSLPNEKRMF